MTGVIHKGEKEIVEEDTGLCEQAMKQKRRMMSVSG